MPDHRLQVRNYYSPVTAVAFVGDVLLIGQGPILKKYHWRSGEILHQKTIFNHNSVHGMAVNGSNEVILWGGRSIAIVDISLDFDVEKEHILNEWITYVSYLGRNVLIQTAHNTVLQVDPHDNFRVISVSECLENSILYSGTILPQKNDKTLVAAGTVLGGIVVWSLEDSKSLHNFTKHEGSIFGVTFSPDGKYLVSCSDDRSIRLWDLETGEEMAIGWGHHARIWQLEFIVSEGEFPYDIVSVSEDCTARRWSLSESTLLVTDVFEGHQGGSVWCCSIEKTHRILATGGQDGKALLFDVDRKPEINRTRMEYHLDSTRFSSISKGETFKKFVCISGKLICTTTSGRTLYTEADNENWKEILRTPTDVYTMLCSFPDISTVCVAIRDGTIAVVRFSENDYQLNTMKVPDQSQLRTILPLTSANHFLVIESQNVKDSIRIVSIENEKVACELERPTTFSIESVAYDQRNKRLYLGSKHGAVALYNLDFHDDMTQVYSPIHCWRSLISSDPVTSINIMPKPWSNHIFITSSNGQYLIASLGTDGLVNRVLLDKLSKGGIEGSWIRSDAENSTVMLLAAFRHDQFYLYDAHQQVPIFSERCGGARRDWSLNISLEDSHLFEMFYSKANVIYRISSPTKSKFKKHVLQQGTHGREVRCIAVSPHRSNGSLIVATSSEDTTIRFSTVHDKQLDLPLLTWSSQRKHISGIPTMKWTPDGRYLFSCSAQEEFLVWKVSDIEGRIFASLCSKLPTSVDDPDVRIMSLDLVYGYNGLNDILIAIVYSDSFIRLWILNLTSLKFSLKSEWRYRSCCLLNCDFLMDKSQLFLAVSATDGYLTIYDIGHLDNPSKALHLQVHQSSVKSSFFHRVDEKVFYFSGGDDNALIVSTIDMKNFEKSSKIIEITNAHSTTITSVCKLAEKNDGIELLTTATDQRVKLWEFSFRTQQLRLSDSIYTAIADTGCLGVGEGTVIIGGSGLAMAKVIESSSYMKCK